MIYENEQKKKRFYSRALEIVIRHNFRSLEPVERYIGFSPNYLRFDDVRKIDGYVFSELTALFEDLNK